jgi:ABC-type glycerol-3-phosphate transport system permease component
MEKRTVVVALAVYIVFQRQIIRGLSVGAIKQAQGRA